MQKITKADIIFLVCRGLILAAAIIGATYVIGSWYLGANAFETIYQSADDTMTPPVEHATAPSAASEATQ